MSDFFRTLLDDNSLESIRNDIILQKDTLYFDWTASGLESSIILGRMQSILGRYANTHSSTSKNANFISHLYLEAKNRLREYLALGEEFYIIPCGSGASGAMKKYQEIKGLYLPPKLKELAQYTPKPQILIGPYEHHSNEISLREGLCEIVNIPLQNGLCDLDGLESLLDSKDISLASLNIASNVSGVIMPFCSISTKLRERNIDIAFDLASISPHANIDSSLFDSIFLSPHKLLGGIGSCGILCIRAKSFDSTMPPTFSGGGSIKYASKSSHFYIDDIESREDVGTPPILQLLKAALAYQYRNEVGLDFIKKREKILYDILLNELKDISGISIYGADLNAEYLPIISFNIEGISPYDLAYELSYSYGIESRAGCSCAGPYGHYLLDKEDLKDISLLDSNPFLKPSWIRLSLHYSHNFADIEYLIASLKKCIKRLG